MITPRLTLWVAVLCWGLGLMGQAQAQAQITRNSDYIVAVVNERPITNLEVRLTKRLFAFMGMNEQASASDEAMLNQLIDTQLVVLDADKSGLKVSDQELEREIATMARNNQLSLAQLRSRIEAADVPWGFFEQHIRDQMTLMKTRSERVLRGIKVSPGEVQKAFDEGIEKQRVRKIHLTQILFPMPESASTAQVQEKRTLAQQARLALMAGQPLQTVIQSAGGAAVASGTDLGEREAGRWPELFIDAIQGLKPGQWSHPVRSGAGWHVLGIKSDVATLNMPTYTQTLARHILKRAATQQEFASARTQLLALRDRLMRRELSFEDAASRYSEDGSATSGGSLGWSSPGNFVPAFEAAMNGLQPGQLSEPVETEFGLHLIQVMERRNVEMTQEQVKFQIEAQLREQKMPKALEDWMLNLRGRAFIEMREPPQ